MSEKSLRERTSGGGSRRRPLFLVPPTLKYISEDGTTDRRILCTRLGFGVTSYTGVSSFTEFHRKSTFSVFWLSLIEFTFHSINRPFIFFLCRSSSGMKHGRPPPPPCKGVTGSFSRLYSRLSSPDRVPATVADPLYDTRLTGPPTTRD